MVCIDAEATGALFQSMRKRAEASIKSELVKLEGLLCIPSKDSPLTVTNSPWQEKGTAFEEARRFLICDRISE
jgi:hypothetical protein